MQVTRYVDVDRWYSIEYDWFYLESLATNFTFRASTSATGDAGDYVNYAGSPVNGSPFAVSTQCATLHGAMWYTTDKKCCLIKMVGGFNWYGIGGLSAARMMVRLIHE
jgi:hypothetical protein